MKHNKKGSSSQEGERRGTQVCRARKPSQSAQKSLLFSFLLLNGKVDMCARTTMDV